VLLCIDTARCAGCRLAQAALDQEDVSETFLKALPSQTERYDVVYPVRHTTPSVRRTQLWRQSLINIITVTTMPITCHLTEGKQETLTQ